MNIYILIDWETNDTIGAYYSRSTAQKVLKDLEAAYIEDIIERDVFGQLDLRPGGISIVKNHGGVREFVSPDTRTLNRLKQRGLEALDLQVRPPILAGECAKQDVFPRKHSYEILSVPFHGEEAPDSSIWWG